MMNKTDSIYFRLVKLLILAAFLAGIAFVVMETLGVKALDYYFSNSDYSENQTAKRIDSFQKYVRENQVKASDSEALTEWIKKQSVVSVQIYRNGILIYDSNYPDEDAIQETPSGRDFYDWETYYVLQFEDGSAEVILYGLYDYQLYGYATLAELFISFLLFLGVVMLGIRKTMKYIRTLNREIGILEGGNLDYPISVTGKDELAMLAGSLDGMRQSLKAQIEQEAYLTRASKKLITEMSHDLRTPITSMLIFTEILRNRKYENEEQMREYVEKIDRKAHQLKVLSEHIFEYSLIGSETDIPLEEPATMKEIFYDALSEISAYLGKNGYRTEMEFVWGEGGVRANQGYLARIMDNIVSNILKYADVSEPVKITSGSDGESGFIQFSNKTAVREKKEDSTQIGLRSMQGMMEKMGGTCRIDEQEGEFAVSLKFRYYRAGK